MNKSIRNTLVMTSAMLLMNTLPATSGGLGGDCCADLEERVAELEATTVRKGNRKVKVSLSGHVNEALLYFDNGDVSDIYVVNNSVSQSRFRLKGAAKINSDVSVGFRFEWNTGDTRASNVRVNDDDGIEAEGTELRHNSIFIKSKKLGKFTMGHTQEVSDGLFHIDLSGSKVIAYATVGYGNDIVFGGTTRRIDNIFVTIDGSRRDVIRYDTPVLAGFVVSASWGEDDIWGVALRFAGTFGDFKVAAGIGYDEADDSDVGPDPTEKVLQGSASILHGPTGLFGVVAYGDVENNSNVLRDVVQWNVKGGIYKRFNSLGKNSFWVEYSEVEQDGAARRGDGTRWGLGALQRIDAAAVELYIGYRHYELSNDATVGNNGDDVDLVMSGARIKF